MSVYIHPTAVVDAGASIGENTKVWHFSHIMPKAVIGENCNIGQNVFIADGVVIGNRVKIQNNVSLYTGVIVEDDVFLGPSMVFTNVLNPRSFVERKSEYKPTIIRKGATVGANATIVCGNEIGKYAFVAAGAVVTKEVSPYGLAIGVPARVSEYVSKNGHKLNFIPTFPSAFCPETGEEYLLHFYDTPENEALGIYAEDMIAKPAAEWLDLGIKPFLKNK
ncbi:MAG: hypothetical protein RI894_2396 [Bacteroidota bacterium]|jgi:UDP-2-acetamido-3-amino-2,3-dideoxy-glucuronate N-acetyltransferase